MQDGASERSVPANELSSASRGMRELRARPRLRVLIACPCYPRGTPVFHAVQRAIQRLAIRSQSEVIYLRRPLPKGESSYANITANYKQARQIALELRVDALLCVEADVLVPEDALEHMSAMQADVMYGLYVWRGQRLWSAYATVDESRGVSMSADPVRARASWGRIIDVEGVGLGCTLIRRDVLDCVDFRLPANNAEGTCCDWMFALDCKRLGTRQRAHLGVICGHLLHDPSGGSLWPDPSAEVLWRLSPAQ